MTPQDFKKFCESHRNNFFKKFPTPGKGPRGFWRDANRAAANALECGGIAGDYRPAFFDDAAERIAAWLK